MNINGKQTQSLEANIFKYFILLYTTYKFVIIKFISLKPNVLMSFNLFKAKIISCNFSKQRFQNTAVLRKIKIIFVPYLFIYYIFYSINFPLFFYIYFFVQDLVVVSKVCLLQMKNILNQENK